MRCLLHIATSDGASRLSFPWGANNKQRAAHTRLKALCGMGVTELYKKVYG
jgi:hypothetical protein